MQPLVSILIPAYNCQSTIADSLDSALSQTWPNKEIIVVDDGSRDDTRAILAAYQSRGVTVFSQPNQGAAMARNRAFSLSHGDYIQWLDADDLLARDKISRQMEVHDGDPRTVLSGSWGRFMYRADRARFVPSSLWCDLEPGEWLVRQMEENVYMQTATWLVSREVTLAAGPWDSRLLGDDDGEYFARVLLASRGSRFVPEAKVYYRMSGPGSLSFIGHSDRKREAQWLSMKLHLNYVKSVDNSSRAQAACVAYLQNWMVYFYPERKDIFERAQDEARALGGSLEVPDLSWKYSWIKALFGWQLARRAQMMLPRFRWSIQQSWDRTMLRMENRGPATSAL